MGARPMKTRANEKERFRAWPASSIPADSQWVKRAKREKWRGRRLRRGELRIFTAMARLPLREALARGKMQEKNKKRAVAGYTQKKLPV